MHVQISEAASVKPSGLLPCRRLPAKRNGLTGLLNSVIETAGGQMRREERLQRICNGGAKMLRYCNIGAGCNCKATSATESTCETGLTALHALSIAAAILALDWRQQFAHFERYRQRLGLAFDQISAAPPTAK
jgi:hypothetical protein